MELEIAEGGGGGGGVSQLIQLINFIQRIFWGKFRIPNDLFFTASFRMNVRKQSNHA